MHTAVVVLVVVVVLIAVVVVSASTAMVLYAELRVFRDLQARLRTLSRERRRSAYRLMFVLTIVMLAGVILVIVLDPLGPR